MCGDAWGSLWKAVAKASLRWYGELYSQGLANTAWRFAKVGRAAYSLLDAIAAKAARRVREFNP